MGEFTKRKPSHNECSLKYLESSKQENLVPQLIQGESRGESGLTTTEEPRPALAAGQHGILIAAANTARAIAEQVRFNLYLRHRHVYQPGSGR